MSLTLDQLIDKLQKMKSRGVKGDAEIIISVDEEDTPNDARIFSKPQEIQYNSSVDISILCFE